MRFQYCSDLHLEFDRHSAYFRQFPLKPNADILLLAGDITYMRNDFYTNPFFDYISSNWETVYWIPGNHEYYCGIEVLSYKLTEPLAIRKNVFLLNNCTVDIDDIRLIFSTLWSKIDDRYRSFIESQVSDFECMVYDGKKLDSNAFNLLHQSSLSFISKAINENKNSKNVIITHHLPTPRCNHFNYFGSKLNSAFVANLDSFIEESHTLAWIYGHSHRNMPEIQIGKTKLLTNQFGYMAYNEHNGFDPAKVLEI